jgi:hypothetical protein
MNKVVILDLKGRLRGLCRLTNLKAFIDLPLEKRLSASFCIRLGPLKTELSYIFTQFP